MKETDEITFEKKRKKQDKMHNHQTYHPKLHPHYDKKGWKRRIREIDKSESE